MGHREVTGARRDERGRTVALLNPDAAWSPVPARLAARQIQGELHTYETRAGGRSAEIRVVQGPSGPYLRSTADPDQPDNLDALPDDEPAHPLTGGFDVLVELDSATLATALRAMHAAGSVPHRAATVADDDVAGLALGAPTLSPVVGTGRTATVRVRTPFLAWVRGRAEGDDPGVTAAGVVDAPVACFTLVEGDGTVALATDWSATAPGDVTLGGALAPDDAERVRAAVLAWARGAGGRYPVPATEAFGAPVGAGLRFASAPGGGTCAQVGLDLAPPVGTLFPAPAGSPVRLALAGTWLVQRVLGELRAGLGALPWPHGDAPVDLGNGVRLTALDAELADRALLLVGGVQVGPVTSARFTAVLRLTGATPGALRATLDSVDVEVADVLSQVADAISGGAVRRAISDGVRGAVSGGGVGDLLGRTTVRATAAAGSAAQVRLDTTITSTTLDRFGVVLEGVLGAGAARGVVARLRVLVLPGRRRLLDALESWSPGDAVAEVRFDYGDGTVETLQGAEAALVRAHDYTAPGRYRASVEVVDTAGRRAVARASVRVV